jgi:hypothetical protein
VFIPTTTRHAAARAPTLRRRTTAIIDDLDDAKSLVERIHFDAPSQVPSAAPTDAQHDCFNRFSAIWSASEIGPSESDCEAAVMDGAAPQLRNVAKKLQQGKCLHIVVMGGSITAGHGIPNMKSVCTGTISKSALLPACAALCTLDENRAWLKARCSDSVAETFQVRHTFLACPPPPAPFTNRLRTWNPHPHSARTSAHMRMFGGTCLSKRLN